MHITFVYFFSWPKIKKTTFAVAKDFPDATLADLTELTVSV